MLWVTVKKVDLYEEVLSDIVPLVVVISGWVD